MLTELITSLNFSKIIHNLRHTYLICSNSEWLFVDQYELLCERSSRVCSLLQRISSYIYIYNSYGSICSEATLTKPVGWIIYAKYFAHSQITVITHKINYNSILIKTVTWIPNELHNNARDIFIHTVVLIIYLYISSNGLLAIANMILLIVCYVYNYQTTCIQMFANWVRK